MAATDRRFSEPIARYANLTLLAVLVCVLAMVLLPVPAVLLDVLLAVNLMAALTLMMVALSLNNSLQLAAFPTLLLLAALFRLGLNIASTRLILSQGYAGRIIETFGRFVTAGHLVIGFVMFLIVTMIQFVVIAKGSERVAEVAARFSLDALPGKQMSIDADLRAGLISQQEARQSREKLQKESRLFGAMDGAMKFVKGDAVAGILITLINLTGGLVTGMAVQGIPLMAALPRYGLLTVGDGLVGQIPALLISISAGIIITRVSDEENQSSLGRDLWTQISAHPKALLSASGLAFLLGWVPGFPAVLFSILASGLAGTGIFIIIQHQRKIREPADVDEFKVDDRKLMLEHVGQAIPLVLEVGAGLFGDFLKEPRWRDCFGRLYPRLKMHLTEKIGVHFPDIRFKLNQNITEPYRYHIRIWDVPVDFGTVDPQHCFQLIRKNTVPSQGEAPPIKSVHTAHGTPALLYHLHHKQPTAAKGIATLGPEEMLLRHLGRVLKKYAGDFVGIQEVHHLLHLAEVKYPELVREVIPKMMSVQKLTEIIKRLVEEDVPIKDFRLILQTLSACQPEEKDPVALTEQVRMGLRRTLSHLYSEEGKKMNVVTIEPEIEKEIRGAVQKNGQECYLILPPQRLRALALAFRECLAKLPDKPARTIILTHGELRRYVRKIIDQELPHQAVLSYQELDPQLILNPVGRVGFPLEAETVVDRPSTDFYTPGFDFRSERSSAGDWPTARNARGLNP